MLRDRAGWGGVWGGVGCSRVRGMLITLLLLRVQSVWLQVMRRWSPGDINVYICTYILLSDVRYFYLHIDGIIIVMR